MIMVVYTLFTVTCSIVMSSIAFLVGRCSRRLPVDGMLPRVVHSARFDAMEEHRVDYRNG